jgi:hypothetical protein
MPNVNPQAIKVANDKLRTLADKFGGVMNLAKALQAEGTAESWLSLFPADAEVVDDGAANDGRAIITNQEFRDFIGDITTFIAWFEANSAVIRNRALKIAVNPERF